MDGELQKQYAPDNNSYGGDVAAGEIIVKYTYETVSNPATTVIVSYTIDVTGNIKVDVDYTGVKGTAGTSGIRNEVYYADTCR